MVLYIRFISSPSLHDSGCVMLQYGLISRLMDKGYGAQGEIYDPQVQSRTLPHCTRMFIQRLVNEICDDLKVFSQEQKKSTSIRLLPQSRNLIGLHKKEEQMFLWR